MLDLTKYTTAVFMNNDQRETANSLNYWVIKSGNTCILRNNNNMLCILIYLGLLVLYVSVFIVVQFYLFIDASLLAFNLFTCIY